MIHPSRIAQAWLQSNPLFLDTETTGLKEDDEIVSIAILGPPNVDFQSLVAPTKRIPAEATRIHGITDHDVEDAPSFFEIQDQVEDLLVGRTVVIYNAEYDVRMLHQSANANRRIFFAEVQPEGIPTYRCAMKLYATFRGETHPVYHTDRWVPLAQAIRECHLSETCADHDAYHDMLACKALVHYIAGVVSKSQNP